MEESREVSTGGKIWKQNVVADSLEGRFYAFTLESRLLKDIFNSLNLFQTIPTFFFGSEQTSR